MKEPVKIICIHIPALISCELRVASFKIEKVVAILSR